MMKKYSIIACSILLSACATSISNIEYKEHDDVIAFTKDVLKKHEVEGDAFVRNALGLLKEVETSDDIGYYFSTKFLNRNSLPEIHKDFAAFCAQIGGEIAYRACRKKGDERSLLFAYRISYSSFNKVANRASVEIHVAKPKVPGSEEFLNFARRNDYRLVSDIIEIERQIKIQNEHARELRVQMNRQLASEGTGVCSQNMFWGWSTGRIAGDKVQVYSRNGGVSYMHLMDVVPCG